MREIHLQINVIFPTSHKRYANDDTAFFSAVSNSTHFAAWNFFHAYTCFFETFRQNQIKRDWECMNSTKKLFGKETKKQHSACFAYWTDVGVWCFHYNHWISTLAGMNLADCMQFKVVFGNLQWPKCNFNFSYLFSNELKYIKQCLHLPLWDLWMLNI